MDISGKKTSGGLSSPDRLWFTCGAKNYDAEATDRHLLELLSPFCSEEK